MTPPLEKWLAEIESRITKTTPGEWITETKSGYTRGVRCKDGARRDPDWRDWICLASEMPLVGQADHNAEFIAHSRTDLPLLIKLLRKSLEQRDYWCGWTCNVVNIDGGYEGQKANENQQLSAIISDTLGADHG